MGEAAEDMLSGICCQVCGEFIFDDDGNVEEVGYPRSCESCAKN